MDAANVRALKEISAQLKAINKTLGYIDYRLKKIDEKLDKNGFTVLPTVETTLTTLEEKEENNGD